MMWFGLSLALCLLAGLPDGGEAELRTIGPELKTREFSSIEPFKKVFTLLPYLFNETGKLQSIQLKNEEDIDSIRVNLYLVRSTEIIHELTDLPYLDGPKKFNQIKIPGDVIVHPGYGLAYYYGLADPLIVNTESKGAIYFDIATQVAHCPTVQVSVNDVVATSSTTKTIKQSDFINHFECVIPSIQATYEYLPPAKPPYERVPGVCEDGYVFSPNEHKVGGNSTAHAQTEEECLKACSDELGCLSVDWNFAEPPFKMVACWLHFKADEPKQPNKVVRHYEKCSVEI